MKIKLCSVLGITGVLFCGCQKDQKESPVVSQRYIHKYGYAISKDEWDSKNYPGQVITTMRNGVTVTATYENKVLHGPCSHTYPHSQTIEAYYLYNQGNVVKEILYDVRGMPISETVQLSPTRYSLTSWYEDGSPISVEEFAGEELLEGEYFTLNNETESRVEKGNGIRVRRDRKGLLLSKDEVEMGYVTKRESFYPSGSPEGISYYSLGKMQGEQKMFTETGEPLSIAEWVNGQLHGKCTYFKNGVRYLEVSYLNNQKNGLEVHYNGDIVSQETFWENNKQHGPSIYYTVEGTHTDWYYDGELVSQEEFKGLNRLDEAISQMSSDIQVYNE